MRLTSGPTCETTSKVISHLLACNYHSRLCKHRFRFCNIVFSFLSSSRPLSMVCCKYPKSVISNNVVISIGARYSLGSKVHLGVQGTLGDPKCTWGSRYVGFKVQLGFQGTLGGSKVHVGIQGTLGDLVWVSGDLLHENDGDQEWMSHSLQ